MKDHPLSKSKPKDEPKDKKKHKKKNPLRMHLREVDGGGYRADHDAHVGEDGTAVEGAEHNLPSLEALQSHIAEHYGPPQEDSEGEAAGAGGGQEPAKPEAM